MRNNKSSLSGLMHMQIIYLILSNAVVSKVHFIPIATRSEGECRVKMSASFTFHFSSAASRR